MKYTLATSPLANAPSQTWQALCHETGAIIAQSDSLEDLFCFCFAHGWTHKENK